LEAARAKEAELEAERAKAIELEDARARIPIDSPADATIAVSREDVEAAIHAKDDGLPRFEIGEPGTGVEDMKIDMPPVTPQASQASQASQAVAPDASDEMPAAASASHDPTVRVSREELEAALKPAALPEEPPFVPQAGLDGIIASFNARHVLLFRALRAEIGAGAANFVKSCRAGLDDGVFALFATADLRADGSWDPEGLRHSIIEHRITDVRNAFEKLLAGELKRLRAHLGEARAAALANQLASIS
jgi:hypothetical protein